MRYEAVVIGASAGGVSALREILHPLPANFALPVLVVQHRPPNPTDHLIHFLNEVCSLTVKEADDKEPIESGFVYVAPANYHLLVEQDKTLSLSIDDKVCHSRPSIDVLFETAADAYRSHLVGIILTGANEDGTAGLKKIKGNGGLTIAQDPATAEVAIMPRSAIEANIIDRIVALEAIPALLYQLSIRTTAGSSREQENQKH